MGQSYQDFLRAVRQDSKLANIQELDVMSKCLLEEIAIGTFHGGHLTITDVLNLKHLGAPSTLHRRIQTLLQNNWIQIFFMNQNRRTKYLELSESGHAYFKRLSELMAIFHGIQSTKGTS
jgi:hypothetical protein